MYVVIATGQFRKDYKLCIKRKLEISLLDKLIISLSDKGIVPLSHQPHILSGSFSGFWECHIKSDWLLIWKKEEDIKTVTLIGTGSHSDFF
jgi:mRNA interferase YafQ